MFPHALIVILAFSIPLSTTFTTLIINGVFAAWLWQPGFKVRWPAYWQHPLTISIMIFIGLNLAGVIYSVASAKGALSTFYQILRLSYIPMLAFYFHENRALKRHVLVAFGFALLITIVCTLLKVYGGFPIGQRTYGNDVFKNHIVTSYFMATALLFLIVECYNNKPYRIACFALIALFLFHLLFLNTGRIGYVVLCVGLATLSWSRYRVKGVLLGSLLFVMMMILAYQFSNLFHQRIVEVVNEFQLYCQGIAISSIGARLEFAVNSIKLWWEAPYLGHGTGSIKSVYQQFFSENGIDITDNPHNQYLKTMLELGLVGLCGLLWLFYSQIRLIQRLTGTEKTLAQAALFSFIIGCFFNSWLKNFTEQHFFILMSAYFLSCYTSKARSQDDVNNLYPLNAKGLNTCR